MMREIDLIVVHCSATRPSQDIGVDEIREWHLARKWSDIGYHYVIRRDGTLETGRAVSKPGAHAQGHNANSIGVCLVGGVEEDGKTPENNFTQPQFLRLRTALDELLVYKYPGAELMGHRDLPGVNKACPSFDVREWYRGQDSGDSQPLAPDDAHTITSADILRLIDGASIDVSNPRAALSSEAREFAAELLSRRSDA